MLCEVSRLSISPSGINDDVWESIDANVLFQPREFLTQYLLPDLKFTCRMGKTIHQMFCEEDEMNQRVDKPASTAAEAPPAR